VPGPPSSSPGGSRPAGDFADPGLLSAGQVSLLTDQYELAMAASYQRRGRHQEAIFEHFTRRLPANRGWLLAAGLAPTLELIAGLRFERPELEYLGSLGFDDEFLAYLAGFRFGGDVNALPEGTVLFADEPILHVRASLVEAQLLETLILNQVNFQTMVASKAARVVLAAGNGELGAGGAVVDFSPRRDHGADAAMKVARSAAIAGCVGTSNVAAAMRYGLTPVGTMAHSYVLSFEREPEAFEAFMTDHPDNAVMLVDTYDSLEGVRNAIEASRRTGVQLKGVRLDSGDLDGLSREARRMLDDAGCASARITASGDLDELRIAELVAAGAPIDVWGVGTELGTSRDSPVVNGIYKLVAIGERDGGWRGVEKLSPEKATRAGAKQVFRRTRDGRMAGDTVTSWGAEAEGEPLLVPVMRGGEVIHRESLEQVRARAREQINGLPPELRELSGDAAAYPVEMRLDT